jgi:uncharacterized protein
MMSLHALTAHMSGTPDIDYPKPERLISGNPKRETWNTVSVELGHGLMLYQGVWRCEPGHWRIAFGPDEHELMTVLKGRCRVHNDAGGFVEAGPGEAISLPAGFSGSFEVLEAVTKTYAIVDRQV